MRVPQKSELNDFLETNFIDIDEYVFEKTISSLNVANKYFMLPVYLFTQESGIGKCTTDI